MADHGTDPIVAGLLLGSVIAQQDAQREATFRTIQAGYMQQGHDAETAGVLARMYLRSQPQPNHGRDLATLFITVPLFLFAVGGLIGWLVGA